MSSLFYLLTSGRGVASGSRASHACAGLEARATATMRPTVMNSLRNVVLAVVCLTVVVAQNRGMEAIYEQQSSQWFDGPLTRATISGDGKWALFSQNGQMTRVITL